MQAKAREQSEMYKRRPRGEHGGMASSSRGGGGARGVSHGEMTAVGSSHVSRGARKDERNQKPHVVLSNKFLTVIDAITERNESHLFRRPVPHTVKGYREKVKNPIDLSTIRDR